MLTIKESSEFQAWIENLRDRKARTRVQARIDRLRNGNPGDVKPVGEGVSEMRIKYGPGYRVYFQQRGETLAILLCADDKRTQSKDIQHAIEIAKAWKSG